MSKRKLKAALQIPELIKEGGGELQCVSLAYEMQKMGHNVTIFTSAYDSKNCFPEWGCELKIISVGKAVISKVKAPNPVRNSRGAYPKTAEPW